MGLGEVMLGRALFVRIFRKGLSWCELGLGMDRFHFFKKRSLRYENDNEKTIVFNGNRFKKWSFSKRSFLKTIVFKNDRSYYRVI